MYNRHTKNTVRYYILIVIVLAFLFFSNDFGLTDVQKTAIVLAVGVDREGDEFVLTSQIAVPQSSTQGKATEAVQLVSRGKTVAESFEQINAKTGWYPKLVFCNLILIGENAAGENVFDALDYFLLDEYLSDNCFVATCNGYAKTLLDKTALVDPSSSAAMTKVLSSHAKRVGSVLPSTLREFAIGYFGDGKSAFLPVLKTEPPQEASGGDETKSKQSGGKSASSDSSSDSSGGAQGDKKEEKPVFSAGETALFVAGKRVATLTDSETFALASVLNELQLASYSVENNDSTCTLSVKQNTAKIKLEVGRDGHAVLKIKLEMTAGLTDYSTALPLEDIKDVGDVPSGVFTAAEKKLEGQIRSVFEKAQACGCDVFGVRDRLVKYRDRSLHKYGNTVLSDTRADVEVHFKNVR